MKETHVDIWKEVNWWSVIQWKQVSRDGVEVVDLTDGGVSVALFVFATYFA